MFIVMKSLEKNIIGEILLRYFWEKGIVKMIFSKILELPPVMILPPPIIVKNVPIQITRICDGCGPVRRLM